MIMTTHTIFCSTEYTEHTFGHKKYRQEIIHGIQNDLVYITRDGMLVRAKPIEVLILGIQQPMLITQPADKAGNFVDKQSLIPCPQKTSYSMGSYIHPKYFKQALINYDKDTQTYAHDCDKWQYHFYAQIKKTQSTSWSSYINRLTNL